MLFSFLLFEEFPYIFLLSISIINSTVIRKHSLFNLHYVTLVNLFYGLIWRMFCVLLKILQVLLLLNELWIISVMMVFSLFILIHILSTYFIRYLLITSFLEKAMAPHSSTLAWKIPWTEKPGGLHSMESWRVGHDWVTTLSLFTFMHWRRKWQPTPVFLPGESQGWRSLVGCHLWGRTESDTTEVT